MDDVTYLTRKTSLFAKPDTLGISSAASTSISRRRFEPSGVLDKL